MPRVLRSLARMLVGVLAGVLVGLAGPALAAPGKLSTQYADAITGDKLELTVWTPAAQPGAADPPVPVAVASPDFGNKPASLAWLGRGLAKRGYLVAIPAHPRGKVAFATDAPPGAVWAAWMARRDAFKAALDAVGALAGWGSRADLDRAAAIGHGGGGMGALAAAGAVVDLRRFARYCRSSDDPLCQQSGGRLRFGGQDPLLFPDAEPRIQAVVALSPYGAVLPTQGLQRVDVPTALLAGRQAPPRGAAAKRLHRHLPDSTLMTVAGLDHGGFAGTNAEAPPDALLADLGAFLDNALGRSP